MIKKFVQRFDAKRDELRERFRKEEPTVYKDIVRAVVEVLNDDDYYYSPDPERIHVIDDGDYQGTMVFIIASTGYQPSKYWYVKCGYGSCSGCDTLKRIHSAGSYDQEEPTKEQLDQYMMLALHILQGIREMYGEEDE